MEFAVCTVYIIGYSRFERKEHIKIQILVPGYSQKKKKKHWNFHFNQIVLKSTSSGINPLKARLQGYKSQHHVFMQGSFELKLDIKSCIPTSNNSKDYKFSYSINVK